MKRVLTRQRLADLVGKGEQACVATIEHAGYPQGFSYGLQTGSNTRYLLKGLVIGGIHLHHTWVDCPSLHFFPRGSHITFTAIVHHYQKRNGDVSFGLRDISDIHFAPEAEK